MGWERVSEALDSAAARFKDGRVTAFDALTKHVTTDLACFLDIEHWQAKVGGGDKISPFGLGEPLNLDDSEDEILRQTMELVKQDPEARPRAEWMAEQADKLKAARVALAS